MENEQEQDRNLIYRLITESILDDLGVLYDMKRWILMGSAVGMVQWDDVEETVYIRTADEVLAHTLRLGFASAGLGTAIRPPTQEHPFILLGAR